MSGIVIAEALLKDAVPPVLDEVTLRVIDACPVALAVSVAVAVIVCVPTLKELVEKLPPVPIRPLMLEVQTRLEVRIPSSASVALPVNEIEEPELKLEPLAGVEMVTSGAVFTDWLAARWKRPV